MFLTEEENPYISFFNFIKDNWTIILYILIFCVILFIFLNIGPSTKKISIDRMKLNERTKKYIPEVYLEIGNSTEKLRYYYKAKMIKKANYNFKILTSDDEGKKICHYLGIRWYMKNTFFLEKNLKKIKAFFDSKSDDLPNDVYYAKHVKSYSFYNEIEFFIDSLEYRKQKDIMIIGNAGTGKTNFICSLFNNLINNGEDVLYINAKDIINETIEDYFWESFNNENKLGKYKTIALKLYMFKKTLSRKKVYVIFEGINENNKVDFSREFFQFYKKYHESRAFKFIITTRTEHYTYQLKNIISEKFGDVTPFKIEKINSPKMGEADFDLLMDKYSRYFNFHGTMSNSTKKIISYNFFLTRIFFQLYKDSSASVDIKNSNEIFNMYLKHLNETIPSSTKIINEACRIMIKNGDYSRITYDLLTNTVNEEDIDKLVSETVLISKEEGYNPNEKLTYDKTYLFFIYDEFRDFLLASYISENVKTPIKEITRMLSEYRNVTEGVIKYLYLNYRQKGNDLSAKKILAIDAIKYVHTYFNNTNCNFLTQIMVECGFEIKDYEIEFVESLDFSQDAYVLLKFALQNLNEGDDVLFSSIIKLMKNPGPFTMHLLRKNKEYYEDLLKLLVNKQYSNKAVLDILNLLCVKCKSKEFFDEEDDFQELHKPLLKRYNDKFIYVNPSVSRKTFLNSFEGIIPKSYYYKRFNQIFNYLYIGRINTKKEYKKYYKDEFKNYKVFLQSIYHLEENFARKISSGIAYFKYDTLYSSNSILNLFCDRYIRDKVIEIGGPYDI